MRAVGGERAGEEGALAAHRHGLLVEVVHDLPGSDLVITSLKVIVSVAGADEVGVADVTARHVASVASTSRLLVPMRLTFVVVGVAEFRLFGHPDELGRRCRHVLQVRLFVLFDILYGIK